MTHSNSVHAIIMTLDEERHLARCIKSLGEQCASITVIDSGSQDETVAIARSLGAEVVSRPWVSHADQINFGIDTLAGRGGWLLRIDADELVDADSGETLTEAIRHARDGTAGLLVQRRIHFMGRRIKHGTIEPSWQLRLWRNGRGRCDRRWMDEHVRVAGGIERCGVVLSDINLNSLTWWTTKHNNYASLEAIELLNLRQGFLSDDAMACKAASPQGRRRRFAKERIYARLSPGKRAFLYFLFRYFVRLGFLDGREGFYFHLLQGLWYRTLVDAKVTEILDYAVRNSVTIPEAIKVKTSIDIGAGGRRQADEP